MATIPPFLVQAGIWIAILVCAAGVNYLVARRKVHALREETKELRAQATEDWRAISERPSGFHATTAATIPPIPPRESHEHL